MDDNVNNTELRVEVGHHPSKMAHHYKDSAILRSEYSKMLEVMRDLSLSVSSIQSDMRDINWKKFKEICDNLMDKVLLLSYRVVEMEAEFDNVKSQINDLEAMSVYGYKDFINTQIDSCVKPLEDRLLTKIIKLEDQYNLGSCVRDVRETKHQVSNQVHPVVHNNVTGNLVSDRNKRGSRIIIEGIPNDLEPLEIINELTNLLELPCVPNKKIRYVKKWICGFGTEHARVLLRVCFDNVYDKNKFLSKSINKKLKNIESSNMFHGVKIYPDRSYAEREHFKLLLNEAQRRNVDLMEGGVQEYIWIVSCGMVTKV